MTALFRFTDFLHLEEFKAFLLAKERAPVTIQGYIGDVVLFARWYEQHFGEALNFTHFSPAAVRTYKQHLLAQQAGPQTINRRLASLAAYADWARQAGHLQVPNPVVGVTKVNQAPLAPRWLDRKEVASLLRAVEKEVEAAIHRYPRLQVNRLRDAAIVHLMLNTGLRVSEVAHLRLTDIQLSDRKGIVIVRQGKGGKRREVPLNARARQALEDYLNARPPGVTESLFLSLSSKGVQEKTIQRAVQRFARSAGLDSEVTPHVLRHTFAKSLVDRGVTLEKVAALLGHSDLSTTQIYVTPGAKDLADAVEKLEE